VEAVSVRPPSEDDDPVIRAEIIHQAWEHAYAHIFSRRELAAVFDGTLEMHGSWTARRTGNAGTLVAQIGAEVIGLVEMALLDGGDGEVAALYVLPRHQRRGAGAALWKAALARFASLHIRHVEVWTMARSAATRFYEASGCTRCAEGEFSIGDHREIAVGYAAVADGAPDRGTDATRGGP
jgi:GNAT superfamily N-acetyltransferase